MHLATENGFLFFGWNRKKILEYILGNANVHSSPPHSLGCADRKLNLRMGKGLFFFFFWFLLQGQVQHRAWHTAGGPKVSE